MRAKLITMQQALNYIVTNRNSYLLRDLVYALCSNSSDWILSCVFECEMSFFLSRCSIVCFMKNWLTHQLNCHQTKHDLLDIKHGKYWWLKKSLTHTYVFRGLCVGRLATLLSIRTYTRFFIAMCLVCDLCRFFFWYRSTQSYNLHATNATARYQWCVNKFNSSLIDMDHSRNVGFVFRFFFLFIILPCFFSSCPWHKIKFVCAEKKIEF